MPREKASKEKVEKVVKPPQNPTIRRELSWGETMPAFCMEPEINPNKRHPAILIVNVARGNGSFQKLRKRRLMRKRAEVPKNPPMPAKSINLNIYATFKF